MAAPRDQNSLVQVYLVGTVYAGTASTDLTTNLTRRLAALSGDMTARLQSIIVSAGSKN